MVAVDPLDKNVALEELIRRLNRLRAKMQTLHVLRPYDRMQMLIHCFCHMVEAGHIPLLSELGEDELGNDVFSDLNWGKKGLPSMDEYCANVSVFRSDLVDDPMNYPRET